MFDVEDMSRTHLLDARIPRWWRAIEKFLRLDISLALQAKLAESQCDIVFAMSEKVGIPLSFLHLKKPLVTVAHHMNSPIRAKFARGAGVVQKWSGIGYVSDESREFLINYFGVNPDRLFQCESSKFLNQYNSLDVTFDGPIMSVGVAQRDYKTLIAAFSALPGYETELYLSSKYGDKLKKQIKACIPEGIKIMGWVSEEELIHKYHSTRFVVVPLQDTTHYGAGISAILEASAFGKAVIATHTGGMSTFVKDGETGILVPPYDVRAWQNAIEKLWTQPELARQMGQAGRHYMESRFNPHEINANIIAFLDKLLMNTMIKG